MNTQLILLSIEEKNDETVFHMRNMNKLDYKTLNTLEEFSTSRQGFFRKDLKKFSVRKKWTAVIAKQVFELLEINVQFGVPAEVLAEQLHKQRISFGQHSGTRWEDIPLKYLKWMLTREENHNWYLANAEVKRRNTTSSIDIDTCIQYGKHKGMKWRDLPHNYLSWLSENLEKNHTDLTFARAALSFQKSDI